MVWPALFQKEEPSPDKTVVVIGGGIAGLSVLYHLRKIDSQVKLIVVDPKDHSEIYWATYRSPFEEWVAKGSLIRLDKYCQEYNIEHVQAVVESVNGETKSVQLGNGTTLSFDVCVVAVGADAHWKGMGRGLSSSETTATARLQALKVEGERILSAASVAVIGGGLIGTELAGDIASYMSDESKKVTLIHSGPHLCSGTISEAAGKALQAQLEDKGVKVILNEKAQEKTPGKLVFSSEDKEDLACDIVIQTIGFQPVNSFLAKNWPQALNEKGWIQTDDCMRLATGDSSYSPNVFAFGDCSLRLPNAGSAYMRAGADLAANLKAVLAGKDDQVKPVSEPFQAHCITTGTDQGIISFPQFWTRRMAPWIKNKTMFFFAPRDTIGIKQNMTWAVDEN